jgi:hypothetical protein
MQAPLMPLRHSHDRRGRIAARPLLPALFVAVSLAGCGGPRSDYSKLALVEVDGVVTLDGEPLSGATVVFRDPQGSFSAGVTDAAGHYRLQFDSVKSGVTPGRKTVSITTRPVGEGGEESGAEEGEPPPAKERIPARYNRASTLEVEVTPSRRTHDFALESA